MPALKISNLVKRYDNGVVAVDGVSLDVPKGAFVGLLGPNGAGKSSTINCIVGVNKITDGTITVFGHDAESDYRAARQQIGIAPQEFNIDIFQKVWKLLDYVAGYYGMPKSVRKERVEELLERFNLTAHRNKEFRSLSGGLKRRVVLARALVHDPDLLILDEPTAGVDVELRHELWAYLRELNAEGKTILLTSHYLEEVELLAGYLAFINDGKIVAQGAKSDFLKDGKKLEETYLSLTGKK